MVDSVLSYTVTEEKEVVLMGIQISEGSKMTMLSNKGKTVSMLLEDFAETERTAIIDAYSIVSAGLIKKADSKSTVTVEDAKSELLAKVEVSIPEPVAPVE